MFSILRATIFVWFGTVGTQGGDLDNILIYTDTERGILKVNLTTGEHSQVEFNHNHFIPIGVDYDPINQMVYWADRGPFFNFLNSRSWLAAISINAQPKDVPALIQQSDASLPSDVFVDYISRLVFYVDMTDAEIGVMDMNLMNRAVLIRDGITEPFSIALDPLQGYMYFNDFNRNKVKGWMKRAKMDGTDIETIASNIGDTTEICIDYEEGKLYWIDANTNNILVCDLDGSNLERITPTTSVTLWGLAVDTNVIYFTTHNHGYILRANKSELSTGIYEDFGDYQESDTNSLLSQVMTDVVLYRSSRQLTGTNACSVNKGGCSHICIPLPKSKMTCKCPVGYYEEGTRCLRAKFDRYLLFTDKTRRSIFRMDVDTMVYERTYTLGHGEPAGITYDTDTQRMYWVDSIQEWIAFDSFYNYTDYGVLVHLSPDTPSGIVFNSEAQTFYYTERRRIKSYKIGESRTNVLYTSRRSKRENPRAITFDSTTGYLYWTTSGWSGKVKRGNINGGSAITLIDTDISDPRDVVYHQNNLYWCDGDLGKIEKVNLLTNPVSRTVLVNMPTVHISSLTVGDNYLYFSTDQNGQIYKYNSDDGSTSKFGDNHFEYINDMIYISNTALDSATTEPMTTAYTTTEPTTTTAPTTASITTEPTTASTTTEPTTTTAPTTASTTTEPTTTTAPTTASTTTEPTTTTAPTTASTTTEPTTPIETTTIMETTTKTSLETTISNVKETTASPTTAVEPKTTPGTTETPSKLTTGETSTRAPTTHMETSRLALKTTTAAVATTAAMATTSPATRQQSTAQQQTTANIRKTSPDSLPKEDISTTASDGGHSGSILSAQTEDKKGLMIALISGGSAIGILVLIIISVILIRRRRAKVLRQRTSGHNITAPADNEYTAEVGRQIADGYANPIYDHIFPVPPPPRDSKNQGSLGNQTGSLPDKFDLSRPVIQRQSSYPTRNSYTPSMHSMYSPAGEYQHSHTRSHSTRPSSERHRSRKRSYSVDEGKLSRDSKYSVNRSNSKDHPRVQRSDTSLGSIDKIKSTKSWRHSTRRSHSTEMRPSSLKKKNTSTKRQSSHPGDNWDELDDTEIYATLWS